jgi:hypothetical protein
MFTAASMGRDISSMKYAGYSGEPLISFHLHSKIPDPKLVAIEDGD